MTGFGCIMAVSSEAGAFMLAFKDDYKYASHAKRVT